MDAEARNPTSGKVTLLMALLPPQALAIFQNCGTAVGLLAVKKFINMYLRIIHIFKII